MQLSEYERVRRATAGTTGQDNTAAESSSEGKLLINSQASGLVGISQGGELPYNTFQRVCVCDSMCVCTKDAVGIFQPRHALNS